MPTNLFRNIFSLKEKTSHRASSWDQKGGNRDFIFIGSGQTKVLAEIEGPGIINHIYFVSILQNPKDFRTVIIKMYWDHEEQPSVEVPLGDFFGVCNCRVRPINSLMITITPGSLSGYGFNMYFPMPFNKHAIIEIENQGDTAFGGYLKAMWYHIDYDLVAESWTEDVGYFHAFWNRENPTKVADDVPAKKINMQLWNKKNDTGKDNYVILDTEGDGQLAGLLLCVDNIAGGWYGEGDDMIFIDDDTWPPSIHGTGSEEIFGGGASPQYEYNTPYSGFHIIENPDYSGINGMYRWYINDPIRFKKRIRWTIEHGHANNFENDYSSVAYWYQKEPHKVFPVLPSLEERMPRFPSDFEQLWEKANNIGLKAFALREGLKNTDPNIDEISFQAAKGLLEGRFEQAKIALNRLEELIDQLQI